MFQRKGQRNLLLRNSSKGKLVSEVVNKVKFSTVVTFVWYFRNQLGRLLTKNDILI